MSVPQLAARWWRRSGAVLIQRAALTYVLWYTAIGVIVLTFYMRGVYQAAEAQADAAASRITAALEQDIRRNLELLDLSLQTAIGRLDFPLQQDPTIQARNRGLIERMPRDQFVDFIEALDEHGDVVGGTPPPQRNENWATRDYFRALVPVNAVSPVIGLPYLQSSESNAGVPVARRMTDRDGDFAGVMVLGMRLGYFRGLFARLDLGPHDSVGLLRDDGTILMRLPYDRNRIGDILDASAPFQVFKQKGMTQVSSVDSIDHVERRFVFRQVGTWPLVVSVGLASKDIDAAAQAQLWPPLIGFGISVFLLALLANRLSHERRHREVAELESREKSVFLTTLSHELRTPLHGVLGYADQLTREATLPPVQSRQVAEIVRAAKHMRDVVNVVLDYARIEARGPALHLQEIDVRSRVQDCVAMVEPSAVARGLELQVTVASGAPARFVTDPVQLHQVLANLLHNAVKYTPRGMVELRVMGDQDHLMIEVADTGIGIPEGQRHDLFKEYERFGAERTGIQGTGLGLAISQRLVRRMGGHIGHRNNPGGGSVFWLELPCGVRDEPQATTPQAAAAPQSALAVLVVDDSDVNREVAEAFLRNAGHTVTAASDGEQAVRLAAEQDFDVILMDMRMSGLDGLSATRRIRALQGHRGEVPIIAITANALDQHAEECRHAGMSEHLAKPFTETELLAVVTRTAAQRPRPPIDEAAIEPDRLKQLALSMGPGAVERLLDCLALRIEALLRQIEEPFSLGSFDAAAELAHEVAGSAGTLGFIGLSSAADQLQRAITQSSAEATHLVEVLRLQADHALTELRRRRSLEALLSA